MKNILILPTDKPSRLFDDGIDLYLGELKDRKGHPVTSYNIYITSDEEIKFNDYITDGYLVWQWKDNSSLLGRKKVILSTDQDLIRDGVQAIDDEFLEWFVKNSSCEEVKVEVEFIQTPDNLKDGFYYKIIIPKEEPCTCTDECLGYLTKTCKRIEQEPKQETLEEAFKFWADRMSSYDKLDVLRFGAVWQQEQDKNKYSEEDMKIAFQVGFNVGYNDETSPSYLNAEQFIKDYKKK